MVGGEKDRSGYRCFCGVYRNASARQGQIQLKLDTAGCREKPNPESSGFTPRLSSSLVLGGLRGSLMPDLVLSLVALLDRDQGVGSR